jgi:hypothetical protein
MMTSGREWMSPEVMSRQGQGAHTVVEYTPRLREKKPGTSFTNAQAAPKPTSSPIGRWAPPWCASLYVKSA